MDTDIFWIGPIFAALLTGTIFWTLETWKRAKECRETDSHNLRYVLSELKKNYFIANRGNFFSMAENKHTPVVFSDEIWKKFSVKLPIGNDGFDEIEHLYGLMSISNEVAGVAKALYASSEGTKLIQFQQEQIEKFINSKFSPAKKILEDEIQKIAKRDIFYYMRKEFFPDAPLP